MNPVRLFFQPIRLFQLPAFNKVNFNSTTHLWMLILVISAGSCKSDQADTPASQQGTIEKPNIVFILADDQRSHTIHALGNQEIITPTLDQLVKTGTVFDNTYIMGAMNGAVCAPSRAMIMTGRALFNIDPTGNTIYPSQVTLPKTLEKAGYHTFHIGKWHNGTPAFKRSFTDGSKIFFGGMHRQYQVPTYEYRAGGDYEKETMNVPSDKHSSELYADAGIEFINSYTDDKPFFMYMALQAPHDPREMPQEYLDMYDLDNISLPPNFMAEHPFDNGEIDIRDEWLAGYPRTPDEVKANIAAYYAMITHLDFHIGRVIKTLEEKGMMQNTIIVFTGDNGLAVGQHGLLGKQNLYEHSIKVPLIIKGPGIAANTIKDDFAYLFDIYPTLCAMTGIPIPETVQGEVLPVNDKIEAQAREGMFFAYKNFQRAARTGDWKIIKYNVDNKVRTQLFNIKNDPFETRDLASNDEYAKDLENMNSVLVEQMIQNKDKANLDKSGWGVPVLKAWKDKTPPDVVAHLRILAEKEREMRGFGEK